MHPIIIILLKFNLEWIFLGVFKYNNRKNKIFGITLIIDILSKCNLEWTFYRNITHDRYFSELFFFCRSITHYWNEYFFGNVTNYRYFVEVQLIIDLQNFTFYRYFVEMSILILFSIWNVCFIEIQIGNDTHRYFLEK